VKSADARLDDIVAEYAAREGPLLPILNAIQAEYGCIDEAAKRHVAHALNLSRAEVHGVVSFYHDLRNAPAIRPILKLCRAEACQARGSDALAMKAEKLAEGKAEIEPVYCLGLCSVGPNAMIGDEVYARLNEAAIAALIEAL